MAVANQFLHHMSLGVRTNYGEYFTTRQLVRIAGSSKSSLGIVDQIAQQRIIREQLPTLETREIFHKVRAGGFLKYYLAFTLVDEMVVLRFQYFDKGGRGQKGYWTVPYETGEIAFSDRGFFFQFIHPHPAIPRKECFDIAYQSWKSRFSSRVEAKPEARSEARSEASSEEIIAKDAILEHFSWDHLSSSVCYMDPKMLNYKKMYSLAVDKTLPLVEDGARIWHREAGAVILCSNSLKWRFHNFQLGTVWGADHAQEVRDLTLFPRPSPCAPIIITVQIDGDIALFDVERLQILSQRLQFYDSEEARTPLPLFIISDQHVLCIYTPSRLRIWDQSAFSPLRENAIILSRGDLDLTDPTFRVSATTVSVASMHSPWLTINLSEFDRVAGWEGRIFVIDTTSLTRLFVFPYRHESRVNSLYFNGHVLNYNCTNGDVHWLDFTHYVENKGEEEKKSIA